MGFRWVWTPDHTVVMARLTGYPVRISCFLTILCRARKLSRERARATKLAEAAGGEVSVSDELYEALSVREPYGEITRELWDYQRAYGILESIIDEYEVADRLMEKLDITGETLGSDSLMRYNLAGAIIDRAVAGDEKASDVIEELFQISQGESKEELLAVGKIVDKYKKR